MPSELLAVGYAIACVCAAVTGWKTGKDSAIEIMRSKENAR